ncbi:MAG: diaminopimelate epimerase [Deltaproteobacteria bacterium]|nr:diaminopimelate epimerase [Deltaproteobacteria bacterium]
MEACGNDFVVVYAADLATPMTAARVQRLCDRHVGVGGDGVLIVGVDDDVEPVALRPQAALSMTVWNADGSLSEMCGNGLRCVVRRALEDGRWAGSEGVMASGAGLVPFRVGEHTIRTTLAVPALGGRLTVRVGERQVIGHMVSMGNPHFVVFDDEQPAPLPDLLAWAPAVELLGVFPHRTNVEHVLLEDGALRVRVWERGVGETLACGSGACAVAAAARTTGRTTADRARVLLPGGELSVSWAGPGSPAMLEGPAHTVFSGQVRDEENR